MSRNRRKLEIELRDSWKRKYFSPASLALYNKLIPRLRAETSGTLLDVGAGTMPFRSYVSDVVEEYRTLDIERKVPGIDLVADIRDMGPVASDSCDVVLCSQVLEHIAEPAKAIREVGRVLRPGGKLVLTVPFLSRLHEEPFDYFRFTRYGVGFLLEDAGLQVMEIVPAGSLFGFMGHQVSTLIVCGVWDIPVLKQVAFWVNAALVVLPCYWLDRLPGMQLKMPLNYVVVAKKPEA